MLKSIYLKYFKSKYFNRLFFIYIAITTIVLLMLSNIVVTSVGSMLVDKEIKFNNIILLNTYDYFNDKINMVKTILKQTYLDNYAKGDIFYFLENNIDSLEYLEKKPAFDNYFFSQFSRSVDMVNLYVYKRLDGQIYQYSKAVASDNFPSSRFKYPEMLQQIHDIRATVKIYPAYKPYYYAESKNDMVYTMSINIKQTGSNENIGTLMIDLDPVGFSIALSKLRQDIIGTILILKKDGEIIYDSSGKYYKEKYPYTNLLNKSIQSAKIDGQDYIINTISSDNPDIIVAGIIPEKSILKKTEAISRMIYFITILSILICIALMLITSKAFSRRVKLVIDSLKEIRNGNLSTRILIKNSNDEIGEIAVSFNKMSEDLSKYIERVYVSEIEQKNAELCQKNAELKQKSAELTALQAQINPHFLYNTLEAIRMKAISGGDHSVAEMIYILSNIFRRSIKGKDIITIEEEISYSELYLNLFKIRYGDNISYHFEIDHEILQYGIIKHMLQPILENYIIHGFKPKASNNQVTVKGYMKDPDIMLVIQDNGTGIDEKVLGSIKKNLENFDIPGEGSIGLANVSDRIKIIYGENYGLDIFSESEKGTTVIIRIPTLQMKELKEHVQGINSR